MFNGIKIFYKILIRLKKYSNLSFINIESLNEIYKLKFYIKYTLLILKIIKNV